MDSGRVRKHRSRGLCHGRESTQSGGEACGSVLENAERQPHRFRVASPHPPTPRFVLRAETRAAAARFAPKRLTSPMMRPPRESGVALRGRLKSQERRPGRSSDGGEQWNTSLRISKTRTSQSSASAANHGKVSRGAPRAPGTEPSSGHLAAIPPQPLPPGEPRGSRGCEDHRTVAPESRDACQRNGFREPRLEHLPRCRKALRSLTRDAWFSSIHRTGNTPRRSDRPPFVCGKAWVSPGSSPHRPPPPGGSLRVASDADCGA